MATLKQIHSARVLRAETAGLAGEGDALFTDRAGVIVSVRTADCYPILLADVERRVVAAVHAGWRGTNAQIVKEALRSMGSDPRNVLAAVGPGIGGCCYFVGEEVARLFELSDAGKIDLAEANRSQLVNAGVPDANVEVVGLCTFCDAERFHSFRREKEQAGRMISFLRMKS